MLAQGRLSKLEKEWQWRHELLRVTVAVVSRTEKEILT